MKQIVRINTKAKSVLVEPASDELRVLGGRALTSHLINSEVAADCDPLGSSNKLVFAGMMLSGTTFTMGNRMSVGCKSPLTGGIKEANVGGTACSFLTAHGIKALILEEQPDSQECNLIRIAADGKIYVENAGFIKGMGTYESCDLLREKFGQNISIIVIGPAGERKYLNSAILVTEFGTGKPCRAAARGGVGAVMGSKGIKAVVIEKAISPQKFPYADQNRFNEEIKKVIQTILDKRGIFSADGTAAVLGITIPSAIVPYQNFSGGVMTAEEQELFNVQKTLKRIRSYGGSTGHSCVPGCLIKCSNIVNDEDGNYLTAGFEYETIGLFGPNCKIFDVGIIAKLDRFCDDFGFDTIELAVSLALYFDSGKLKWSDGEGALAMFQSFYEGGELADDFGMGSEGLGKKYGVKHIPSVKGQSLAAYEPRNLKGTGAVYALSPMGADHTCGSSLMGTELKPTEKAGSLEFAIDIQNINAMYDSNVCLFARAATIAAINEYANAVNAAYGLTWTSDDIIGMGAKTVLLEREFNRRAGITSSQDVLPDFFYKEPSAATGSVFDINAGEIAEKWHN